MSQNTPVDVVFGAGGGTGKLCVQKLLEQGRAVRAVVRNPSKYEDVFPKNDRLEVAAGDVTDPDSLPACLKAAEGVIVTTSAPGYWQAEAVDNKGVGNIASAALQAGAKRVLLVSSIFVTKRRRFNPLRMLLNSMIWGMMDQKLQGEDLLRGSGLSYTVVRPSGLYNGPGGQHKLLVGQGDELSGRVSRADVADVCIAALRLPQAHNVTMEVIQGAKELDQPGQLDSLFTGLKADT